VAQRSPAQLRLSGYPDGVGRSANPWHGGRRAWERLDGWHQDKAAAVPGHPDDGDRALDALADVGLVRRLLDQAELVAVRTARRHGKSWAEIATRLGVTRQSAWERWRELDERATPRPSERLGEAREREAQGQRRRSSATVPNVIGMSWDGARQTLLEIGLVGVGPDPDGPPLGALGWPDGVVTDQSPESGAKVPPGSQVRLWVERGGGSGVRESRRPKPEPRIGRAMRDELTDEAVG
jgi:hypothetical protein